MEILSSVVVFSGVMYVHAMKLNNLSEGSLINNILYFNKSITSFPAIHFAGWFLSWVSSSSTNRGFSLSSSSRTYFVLSAHYRPSVSFLFCVAMKLMLPFIILLLLYIFKHTALWWNLLRSHSIFLSSLFIIRFYKSMQLTWTPVITHDLPTVWRMPQTPINRNSKIN